MDHLPGEGREVEGLERVWGAEGVPGGGNATCPMYEERFEVVALVPARDDDNLNTNIRMFEMTGDLERHV